jgi:cell division protein FtsQ
MRTLKSKTRPRNRRLSNTRQRKQRHLLDVKVRARTAARHRNRRIFTWVCSLILLAAIVGGAVYGVRAALTKFLWENPDYNLTDLEIVTDGTLGREEVISAASIVEGANIFSLSLSKVRKAINDIPQVESVTLQRALPNRISIRITERKPIAWITAHIDQDPTTAKEAFLADSKGILIERNSSRELSPYLKLPVIAGVNMENMRSGAAVSNPDIQSALDLIRLNMDNARFEIRTLDLSKGYCMLVTDQRHAEITFGLERISEQLDRLAKLFDYTEPRNKVIRTANLMPSRNVPVTFYDPSSDIVPLRAGDSEFGMNESAPRKIPPKVLKALPVLE